MANETITMEWIASATKMNQVIDRLNSKFDKQEKALQKLATTSKKTAEGAAGSFNKLEQEFKDNEKALKKLQVGTKAFAAQKRKVDDLRTSLGKMKGELRGDVAQQSGAAAMVNSFTAAISGTVVTILGVGTIVASLKSDLENIARKRENERLAEVDFGRVMASKTISNLAEGERSAVKPLALNLADELGLPAGGVLETIGNLKSVGAEDIIEAGTVFREAAKAFPQDLAASSAIARAAFIEMAATGNRNAREVIGGVIQAQAVSLAQSPEAFANAFGANIASAVAVQGLTPERAKEQAAIFSVFEPKSPQVAADAQRSFLAQMDRFVPEQKKTLRTGEKREVALTDIATFLAADSTGRQAMLQSNESLRKQFVAGLQETGRGAITRRLAPGVDDAKTISRIQAGITDEAGAEEQLGRQQSDAATAAAFAIAQGQREAQKQTTEIRSSSKEKLTAELEKTMGDVVERTRTGIGGFALNKMEEFGARVEQFATGDTRGEVLENTLRARAATETDPFVQQQVGRIDLLNLQMKALDATNKDGNEILRQMLAAQPGGAEAQPIKIAAPAMRPAENPLSALSAP